MTYQRLLALGFGLIRTPRLRSDRISLDQAGAGYTGAPDAARPMNRILGAASLIALAATTLVGALSQGPLQRHDKLVGLAGLAGHHQPSRAVEARAPKIIVASTIYADSSEPLPMLVEIEPLRGAPVDSTLHVRGLPAAATLSEGHRLGADVWAVPVSDLPNLEIRVAAGISERSDLSLALVAMDGSLLATAHTVLAIYEPVETIAAVAAARTASPGDADRRQDEAGADHEAIKTQAASPSPADTAAPMQPARGPGETKTASAAPLEPSPATAPPLAVAPPLAAAKVMTQEERLRAERMIARGVRDLDAGNVANARQFFLRAAEAGLAEGAFLLASTFDPLEFAGLRVVGLQPNLAFARKWYERAGELGHDQAQERLARLGVAD